MKQAPVFSNGEMSCAFAERADGNEVYQMITKSWATDSIFVMIWKRHVKVMAKWKIAHLHTIYKELDIIIQQVPSG